MTPIRAPIFVCERVVTPSARLSFTPSDNKLIALSRLVFSFHTLELYRFSGPTRPVVTH